MLSKFIDCRGCLALCKYGVPIDRELTWISLPVTILPTARKAGVSTVTSVEARRATNLGTTPVSITAWILSLVPSVRYDKAQHVSAKKEIKFKCHLLNECSHRWKLYYQQVPTTSVIHFACNMQYNSLCSTNISDFESFLNGMESHMSSVT